MNTTSESFPALSPAIAFGLRGLPLAPLEMAANLVARSLARRHPSLFVRLGEHAGRRFLIEPTDLPLVALMVPDTAHALLRLARSRAGLRFDARITGRLSALLGLLNGDFDGDALFFSRDIAVEGDISAVLALRNALDDARIDVLAEIAAVFGPFSTPAERLARRAAPLFERATGIALVRPAGAPR
jgi:predicted lipid carrier protein YhbT